MLLEHHPYIRHCWTSLLCKHSWVKNIIAHYSLNPIYILYICWLGEWAHCNKNTCSNKRKQILYIYLRNMLHSETIPGIQNFWNPWLIINSWIVSHLKKRQSKPSKNDTAITKLPLYHFSVKSYLKFLLSILSDILSSLMRRKSRFTASAQFEIQPHYITIKQWY